MSSFKLKKIFYENDVLPVRNPIYSQYNGQTIGVIIVDDTRLRRRSGGRRRDTAYLPPERAPRFP